jgi:hypothetical protein
MKKSCLDKILVRTYWFNNSCYVYVSVLGGRPIPYGRNAFFSKTADPYSTLVLSPFDDGGIPAASYPNLPAYPVGQERVTVLQTGKAPYAWVQQQIL